MQNFRPTDSCFVDHDLPEVKNQEPTISLWNFGSQYRYGSFILSESKVIPIFSKNCLCSSIKLSEEEGDGAEFWLLTISSWSTCK